MIAFIYKPLFLMADDLLIRKTGWESAMSYFVKQI